MNNSQKHILYAVLDWGLGHATRSMVIIRYLLSKNVKVSIIGNGDSLLLLKEYFPQCTFYNVEGIKIIYPTAEPLSIHVIRKTPSYLRAIKKEHFLIDKLIDEIKPDALISDNRFGAYTSKISCVFISHQLRIRPPFPSKFLESFIYYFNRKKLSHFKTIWVPDYEKYPGITGWLSHHPKAIREMKPIFIDPLSRFTNMQSADIPDRYELLILISGPEPQRSNFEKICRQQAKISGLKTLIVRGKPKESETIQEGLITEVPHLKSEVLKAHFEQSKYIVCRSGHTSMMDLAYLKRTAICIPTPGQTEQEYLAKLLSEQHFIVAQKQNNFNLQQAINELEFCIPPSLPLTGKMEKTVDEFLKTLN